MSNEQIVINESELGRADLDPSEKFARLVKRVGDRATLGTLGLSAIEDVVRERASKGDVSTRATALHAAPRSVART
jgi:hypothetical protein